MWAEVQGDENIERDIHFNDIVRSALEIKEPS